MAAHYGFGMKQLRSALGLVIFLLLSGGTAFATGTPANTEIKNTARVDWLDAGGSSYNQSSNEVTVTVQAVYTGGFSTVLPQSGVTGTTVYYAVTLTNSGNATNGFDLVASTDLGWTTTIYHDVGTVGTYESGTDTVTATTGADALAQDTTYAIIVAVTIPAGTANTTVGTTTITATGNSHATTPASNTMSFATTAQTPVLSITKGVKNITASDPNYVSATNAKPNEVLEYQIRIKNDGAATANKVYLTDTLNTNLTFDTATYSGFYIGPDASAYNGNTGANGKDGGGTGNFASGAGSGEDTYACSGSVCGKGFISGSSITVNLGQGATDVAGGGGSLAPGAIVYVYFRGKVK